MRAERAAAEPGDALRALAALMRSGLPPAQALAEWPGWLGPGVSVCARAAARRIKLGAAPAEAVSAMAPVLGPDAELLAGLLAVHGRLGGDAAGMLEAVAVACEERARWRLQAEASTAGATLSGRMVAGLPLAFAPFAPLAGGPVADAAGAALMAAGGALATAGLVWMGRLVPRPPESDATAMVADMLSAVMQGGAPLPAALECICAHAPGELSPPLAGARRLVLLGAAWPDALARCGGGPAELGGVLRRSQALGLPVSAALTGFARQRRARQQAAFARRLRRAPVLMTLPLTLCVLPSFMLLAVVPYIRGVAGA